MTETSLQSRILKALGSRTNVRLFRNQQGFGWVGTRIYHPDANLVLLKNARPVTFGLHPGSSDLIGWHTVTITPAMVGHKVAIFLGVEVKTETGVIRANQKTWKSVVTQHGGIAIIARSDEIEIPLPWS